MSFLVVNTGRAASRGFYLNLRRQPGVITFNRYHFDLAVRTYIKRNLTGLLRKLADGFCEFRALRGDEAVLGLVFHSARRRFNFPYDHPRNEKALRVIRALLGIKTIFFPVREPRSLFLSELNRNLAAHVGDWRFGSRKGTWRTSFTLDELDSLRDRPPAEPEPTPETVDIDTEGLLSMARNISRRTGKIYSLYRLFEKVFGDGVHYIDYKDFLARPAETFGRMAAVAGFRFEDPSLVDTRVNGLANRLLVYNLVHVVLENGPRRLLRGRGGRNIVRYRFELSQVLPLCDDWGYYDVLDADCSGPLREIEADLGNGLCLGINVDDAHAAPGVMREVLRHPGFADRVLQGVAPLFVENYKRTKRFFAQQVHLREIPEPVYDVFWKENRSEYEQFQEALERGQVTRL